MFSGYIQENPSSGNFPPQPPPSPVRLGNTLIVSTLGDDATAVRQDQVYHFLTVDAALNAAQTGDMIIIYPGSYVVTHASGLCVGDIQIHCMPGAILAGGLFRGFDYKNFKITGQGTLIAMEDDGSAVNLDVNVPMFEYENIYIGCLNLSLSWSINRTGGNITFDVANYLTYTYDPALSPCIELYASSPNGGTYYIHFRCKYVAPLLFFPSDTIYNPIFRITDITTNGYVKIEFELFECDGWSFSSIDVQCSKPKMDWLVDVKGDMLSKYGDTNPQYYLTASGNRFWDLPPNSVYAWEQPNGFYFRGRLYSMNSLQNFIYLFGGKLEFTGDMFSAGAATFEDTIELEGGSHLLLMDGYARVLTNDVLSPSCLVNYLDSNNIVQFQNYRVYVDEYVVKSAVPAQVCNILSCYSNGVLSPDVSNQIIGTSLIVDPNII